MAFIDSPTQMEGISQEAKVVALEENRDPLEENRELSPVVAWVKERFLRSKTHRQQDETRWLDAYRNFRGTYDQTTAFTDEEKSKVFVKITKTKVLAAVAQLGDILFAGNKFPIGIEPTPETEGGTPDKVHVDFQDQAAPEQGQSSLVTRPELQEFLTDKFGQFAEKAKEGAGSTPSSITYEPVKLAAKKMEKKIHDQLEESDASKHLRYMAFEMALFGTGIIKGPFAVDKEYPKWDMDPETNQGVYNPSVKTVPKISSVSIWNFYPDPDAHSISECTGVVERHKLSRFDLLALKKRPMFRHESIDEALRFGYNYHPEYWESTIEDFNATTTVERYEVLEYWGMISGDDAREAGIDNLPDDMDGQSEYQVNIWICNDQILRLVLNPYTPKVIPYYATPYEINPYSFFGIGVAENMSDTQMLMNGFMRMAVDNAALSGNLLIEVDETNLAPGQDMKVYPGKVFRRQSGAPGQSIFGFKFPNVSQDLLQLFDKARQLTDEATNMPSYAHGGTGVPGVGRTAAGMGMLMGAAAQSIKAVVRNIDDYFLSPLGKNLFAFNMQFAYDKDITGDLDVVAKGTESLMRNEIRSQRLLQFLQTAMGNPVTMPLVNADYILRELATSMDLDEEMVVNDARKMMIQAQMIKEMQAAMGTAPSGPEGGAPAPSDPTGSGGGNIGPGNAPEPGAQGFSGGGGGNNGGSVSANAEAATAN